MDDKNNPTKNVFACWSCKNPVTMRERADADGNCPNCAVELDIDDWPFAAGVPATQPQGEPVAHCLLRRNGSGEWVNDAKSWADGAPSREIMAECEKHPELYQVRLAHAEQPAPVAVVLPERLAMTGRGLMDAPTVNHHIGWNACLDELKRLNPSL